MNRSASDEIAVSLRGDTLGSEGSGLVPFDADVLFWAFRYALGRMTYAVSDVAMALHVHKARLSEKMRATICREIDEAAQRDRLGHACDAAAWFGVRDALLPPPPVSGGGE